MDFTTVETYRIDMHSEQTIHLNPETKKYFVVCPRSNAADMHFISAELDDSGDIVVMNNSDRYPATVVVVQSEDYIPDVFKSFRAWQILILG